ncbi:50S ribosomal protein L25/general stress protein Ctc [Advenella sp. WQ 585]|uniref:Large ribosomal subunit protein bL25 n=1 Tax=Advenella mandrilli TaxID=2800330 RepID=A0ABS1EDK2_9BURK|nr:50S ribosomal protein L25/general stress protein Ctc [Advenella mandrilli]MBK1781674.1 50S ribosomal protein L25/general stress protein Ctc [Advenella mandrilli]
MKFTATSRSVQGSSASRRLRRAGRVPAIVYGGKTDALSIELDHNEIFHALRKEGFHASVLNMELDGNVQNVLLRAVQWHPYKPLVMHVDFQRVSADQAITTKVPLHFINEEISPAVKLQGAQITRVANDVEITCLPSNLPQFIEVDLAGIEAGGVFHLSQIAAPEGVQFVVIGDDPVLAAASTAVGESGNDAEDGEAAE